MTQKKINNESPRLRNTHDLKKHQDAINNIIINDFSVMNNEYE